MEYLSIVFIRFAFLKPMPHALVGAERSGDFLTPSQPAQEKKASARQDQAGQSRTGDGAWYGARLSDEVEVAVAVFDASRTQKRAGYDIHTRIEEKCPRTEVGISEGLIDIFHNVNAAEIARY